MRTGFKWIIALLVLSVIGFMIVPTIMNWFVMM